jgi:hypothetical protein
MAERDESFTSPALESTVQYFSSDLRRDLGKFAANELDKSRNPFKGNKTTLEYLVEAAIRLDATIKQQRPLFCFRPNSPEVTEKWNLKFSESSMVAINDEDEVLLEGKQVRLVLNPGVCKYGNSAGRNYGQGCTILRAQVDIMATKWC